LGGKTVWDCDVALKTANIICIFPERQNDIFRIGVAVSDKPYGPFIPEKHPMMGSYSIDPVFLKIKENIICISEESGADNCNVTEIIKH
jgi:hypothetical protein